MKKIILVIPLLFIVKNYGKNIEIRTAPVIETRKIPNTKYLYKCVYTESRGEPEEGQKAIVEVILNRVYSNRFPNTIDSVVMQNKQFAYNSKLVVPQDFKDKINNFVIEYQKSCYYYFLNPETATNKKMLRMSRKKHARKIGNHIFF